MTDWGTWRVHKLSGCAAVATHDALCAAGHCLAANTAAVGTQAARERAHVGGHNRHLGAKTGDAYQRRKQTPCFMNAWVACASHNAGCRCRDEQETACCSSWPSFVPVHTCGVGVHVSVRVTPHCAGAWVDLGHRISWTVQAGECRRAPQAWTISEA